MSKLEIVEFDDNKFIELFFSYNAEFIEMLKQIVSIRHRTYNPEKDYMWRVDKKYGDEITDLARKHFESIWWTRHKDGKMITIDINTGEKIAVQKSYFKS